MIFKYGVFYNGLPKIQKLLGKIEKLHSTHVNGPEKRKEPLLWCIRTVNFISNITYILFTLTNVSYTIFSLYFYFVKNIRELPMGMLIPFLDNSNLAVYYLNLVVQVFLAMQVGVGIMSNFDNVMILFVIHAITFIDHFKLDLEEFEEYLKGAERMDSQEVKSRLNKVLERHQEIIA